MRQGIACKLAPSIFKSPTFIPSIYHKSIFDLYLPAALSLITCSVGMDEAITGANVQCQILGQSGKIRMVYTGNNTG